MRKRKATNNWAGNLRRSLALALVLSGGHMYVFRRWRQQLIHQLSVSKAIHMLLEMM